MLTYLAAGVRAVFYIIGRGMAMLIGGAERSGQDLRPTPARARSQIYWRRIEPEDRHPRTADLDSMSEGCVVYRRPQYRNGER